MNKYYFTFGKDCEGQPYDGGWVEVEADTESQARDIFLLAYGRGRHGFLNCAMVYPEERFLQTTMAKEGNFGAFCHERVKLQRTPVARYAK